MFSLLERMIKNPKISIITAVLNSAKTIADSIASVVSQEYDNIEYIIIDGGSTDGTINIVRQYAANIKYFSSEPDNGIYYAMNKGIEVASGDVIGILNSDDFYSNSFVISNVAKTFEEKGCDAVYGDLVYVKTKDISKITRYWKAGEYSTTKIKNGWMLPHPTFFVKSEVYKRFGLYNTDFKSASDYEMILKLLYKNNIVAYYIPMILVIMRRGGKSNRSVFNRIMANKEDSLAWTENGLTKPLFVQFKKPLYKLKQFFLTPKI